MSWRRFLAVARLEFRTTVRRPLYIVLLVLLALIAWGLSSGAVQVSSGASDVGGRKAFITSMSAIALSLAVLGLLLHGFFVAVGAGMSVIRDEELRVGNVLHATPLTPREYVWGKFTGIMAAFGLALLADLLFRAIANHLLTGAAEAEIVGPFELRNYALPLLAFGLPTVLFVGGASFAIGSLTRRPILVFFLPTALLLVCLFFVWAFSPAWLSETWNSVLMALDPAGFRWLNERWLEVDRGVDAYNTQTIAFDGLFLANRVGFVAIGLGAVAFAARRFEHVLLARSASANTAAPRAVAPATGSARGAEDAGSGLAQFSTLRPARLDGLAMRALPPSFLQAAASTARAEVRELRNQPGLYLFVPLILLQIIGTGLVRTGAFDTPLLATPGVLAAGSWNTIVLLLELLLLFYTVESLERERARGLDAIHGSTPTSTAAILAGKSLANSVVGVVVLLAAYLASAGIILFQGRMAPAPGPFLLLWGVLLLPTLLVWTSFVSAAWCVTRSRYGAYAVGLALLAGGGWLAFDGQTNWVTNWNLWSALRWSDMSVLEIDRGALVLNRAFVLVLAVFFTLLAVRFHPRRSLDGVRTLQRLAPRPLFRAVLPLAPVVVAAVVLGTVLYKDVQGGSGGADQRKYAKDYWRRNIETWRDAPVPAIRHVDITVDLEPAASHMRVHGTYELENDDPKALALLPITPGRHYRGVAYTIDGVKAEHEDRSGLHVLKLTPPLAPGSRLTLGFEHEADYSGGTTKNGGGAGEFVLPGGVVMTSFGPSFAPSLGFLEEIGLEAKDRPNAKEYTDDFYVGPTPSVLGTDTPYSTRVRISVPEGWRANSVGTLVEETASEGRRTFTWESDHPVTFFNVVAGRWSERRGEGVVVYHHPDHVWNIDEITRTLEASRRRYSEWFAPFPWQELKLSEFPALAGYAQGFPTNITFSESIGFLTRSDPRANAAFMVTAHEAAHQWWGNMLNPGKGPGGNVLSEGMAHFSTILLHESELGLRERIEFCKHIEDSYGSDRQVDSERPLVKMDGSRAGDTTVTYDKGGWVAWMLLHHMGREQNLAGLREFLRVWGPSADHPVLQDFVAALRPFAADTEAYDAFTRQWYFEVVVPEYRLEDVKKEREGEGWVVRATLRNAGTSTMPVEVSAARGTRFEDPDKESARPAANAPAAGAPASATVQAAAGKEAWREARTTVVAGPKSVTAIEIHCDFEPVELVVDPDALVLQLERKKARASL
ncbi:MAG: M1 family aminopeptidase [Planctomycetota bacterium]|nr:M1 family aminopeptidase [Planctomycetota bacterium]